MGNKDWSYKTKAHITNENSKKFILETHRKQDLIGAIIFAIILMLLLFFMPKKSIASETKIQDEITAWYESTSTSIKDDLISLGNNIAATPEKVGTSLLNFWEEVKIYQTESWSKTREENPGLFGTIDRLKEYFIPSVETKKE